VILQKLTEHFSSIIEMPLGKCVAIFIM